MHGKRSGAGVLSLAIVASLALLTAACSSAAPEWDGTIEERDGAAYIVNPAEALWAGSEAPPLRFVLEQSYGSDGFPEEAMLGHGLSFAADEASNVYVLDPQNSRIIAFARDGSVRWIAGRPGEGRGELEGPLGLALSGDGTIAIMNQHLTRIDLWSTAGVYLGGHSLQEPPLDVEGIRFPTIIAGFLDPQRMVLQSPVVGTVGARIRVVDLSAPAVVGDFVFDPLPGFEVPAAPALWGSVRATHGRIWLGSGTDHRFRIYTAEGKLLREVARPFAHTMRPGMAEDSTVMGFGGVFAPMPLASGHLLVAVYWTEGIDDPDVAVREFVAAVSENRDPPELQRGRALELHDAEGRFLYSYQGDDIAWAEDTIPLVGPDGRFYILIYDPYPQVLRYRVIIRSDGNVN